MIITDPYDLKNRTICFSVSFTHISLASFLWDIGKQNSPRWDAAKRGVSSGAIPFAFIFISSKNEKKKEKLLLTHLKMKVD